MQQTAELKNLKPKLIKMKGGIYKSMITGGNFNMPILRTDGRTRKKISQDIQYSTTPSTNGIKSAFIKHSTQQHQHTHSFQVPMEHTLI